MLDIDISGFLMKRLAGLRNSDITFLPIVNVSGIFGQLDDWCNTMLLPIPGRRRPLCPGAGGTMPPPFR
jgi:hypothetical protein